MSSIQHTPGPWDFGLNHTIARVESDGQREENICLIPWTITEKDRANACLIAAAPELLEACKKIRKLLDEGKLVRDISQDGEPGFAVRQLLIVMAIESMVAAITRAEGPNQPR